MVYVAMHNVVRYDVCIRGGHPQPSTGDAMMNHHDWVADGLGRELDRLCFAPGRALGGLTLMYGELMWLTQLEASRLATRDAVARASRAVPEADDGSVQAWWQRQLAGEQSHWQRSLDTVADVLRIHQLYGRQLAKLLAATAQQLSESAREQAVTPATAPALSQSVAQAPGRSVALGTAQDTDELTGTG